jgi:hypothetical protein
MESINYQNKKYKIHIGKKGGKYILKNNKKIYINNKNLSGGFFIPEITVGAVKTAGYLTYALYRLNNSLDKNRKKK